MTAQRKLRPVRDFRGRSRRPVEPTYHLPKTEGKLRVMAGRAERGEELNHDDDARPTDRYHLEWTLAVNHARVLVGVKIEKKLTDSIPVNSVAYRVRNKRECQGLTRKQLAFRAGISVPYLSMIERNNRQPSLSVLVAIADVLKVGLDELLGRKVI